MTVGGGEPRGRRAVARIGDVNEIKSIGESDLAGLSDGDRPTADRLTMEGGRGRHSETHRERQRDN